MRCAKDAHSLARKIHERERGNNWIPIGAAGVSTAAPATEPQTQDRDLRALSALKVRVREALSIAHWGEPDTAFERQMARLQKHGLDLGAKYRSHHLVQSVEHLAAGAARARTADALDRDLGSLGIPSDLNLIFDGVSIGATAMSRHETLNVIGFSYMGVPSEIGDRNGFLPVVQTRLLAAPSSGLKHAGDETVASVSQVLCEHPGRYGKRTLQSRLAGVGSDGAGTLGGEDALHKSTGACELLWKSLHPNHAPGDNMPVDWELFHRVSLVFEKTIKDIPCAGEIFEVSQSLGALFGVGDGRVILRGAADQIGARRSRVPDQGGSRKVIALANTIEHLLNNQKTFHAAMHARIALSESLKQEGRKHHGRQSKIGLVTSRHAAIVF